MCLIYAIQNRNIRLHLILNSPRLMHTCDTTYLNNTYAVQNISTYSRIALDSPSIIHICNTHPSTHISLDCPYSYLHTCNTHTCITYMQYISLKKQSHIIHICNTWIKTCTCVWKRSKSKLLDAVLVEIEEITSYNLKSEFSCKNICFYHRLLSISDTKFVLMTENVWNGLNLYQIDLKTTIHTKS